MDFKKIKENEYHREYDIYVYNEGLFYKVYNESALIFNSYIHDGYKINTKYIKYLNDYFISIGMPKETFEKLLCNNPNVDIVYNDQDKVYGINLKNKDNINDILSSYIEWKNNIVCSGSIESNTKTKNNGNPNNVELSNETYGILKNLIKEINNFPSVSSPLYELPCFIAKLQNMCREINI